MQPGHSVGMLAAVEHGPILCSDSNILCLSWKGRVPKSEKDKPVCRRRYYEEGWLATGNGRGVVGVTFTSSHCRRDRSTPQRINFNLRGHNSEVRPFDRQRVPNGWQTGEQEMTSSHTHRICNSKADGSDLCVVGGAGALERTLPEVGHV